MRMRIQRKNLTDRELAKALAGVVHQEGITHEIVEHLHKADDHEDAIPEKYVRYIIKQLQREYQTLMATLNNNIAKWFEIAAKGKKKFLRKAEDETPPVLNQQQIDELRSLIQAHFRRVIGVAYKVPESVQKRWNGIGIKLPDENMEKWIINAYLSGRVSDVLNNNSTFADMVKAAKKFPMSRLDQLVLEAAKQNAAKYISGYGTKLADLAEDMLVTNHKAAIHDVVQKYFSGELTHTLYNEEGFTPQEAESLLSTDKAVKGWQELSTELKNRFKAVDIGRNWDRVAISETRYATNLGRIVNIQIEGGGKPDEIEIYYHVQPTACKHCKSLYLEPDGTPRIFKLSEIMRNVQKTGGMNVGLKPDEWAPNVVCHPYCHCYQVRKISGYKTIPMGDV